jgi:hypothetical protein
VPSESVFVEPAVDGERRDADDEHARSARTGGGSSQGA